MRILFSSQATVQYDGECYYSSALNIFYQRYLTEGDDIYILSHVIKTDNITMKIINNPRVHILDIDKINSLKKIFSNNITNLVEEQVQKADFCIIHIPAIHSYHVIDYAKKVGKPFMTVVVGCAWDAYWNYGLAGKLIALPSFLRMRFCQNKSKYSIYVTKSFLQKRYPPTGKFISCSNVNVQTSKEDLQRRLKHIDDLNKVDRPLKLVTAAAIDVPYKGQQFVIEALSILKKKGIKMEYSLAGNGSSDRLCNLAKKLGVIDQVHFCGLLSREKIIQLLDDSDVYIQPSKQEGLPRAVIEAMSRGLLCIGSNIAGIPELLENKYLFAKGDSIGIANILGQITTDDLISSAKTNFEIAVSYDKETLDEIRSSFIKDFRKKVLCNSL